MNKSTAILLFSRTATDEAAHKTFDSNLGKKGNIAIAKQLIQHSLAVAQATQLPVFSSYSDQQKGSCFGERLANAIEAIYTKGFDAVLVIGNDSPSLTSALLLESKELLASNNLVLGPSKDGGVYLIGIQKSAYNRQKFIDLAWESDALQASWEDYNNSISWLTVQQDIDHSLDFQLVLKQLKTSFYPFYQQLIAILATYQYIEFDYSNTILQIQTTQQTLSLRGPPTYY